MDYSLLVGISPENGTTAANCGSSCYGGQLRTDASTSAAESTSPRIFRMGIIDYLQRWTPKKVAAHWLKKLTIGCTQEIDTEPPTVYCKRFAKHLASNGSKIQVSTTLTSFSSARSLP
mmetsp:Transcript_65972/g.185691  ORF Transcript_65972/g.185691 Transcript_65972/m.185691 type:complete len:118 (-) Transcript_65972:77-430(-)